jgi:hypothetical protein
MKYLVGLLVLFATLIVFLGLRKPVSNPIVPDEEVQEDSIPTAPAQVTKIAMHGENSRLMEEKAQKVASQVLNNKSGAIPQSLKAISPNLKGLERIYEIEKRTNQGASKEEIAMLSYYELVNNVPDAKEKFTGPHDERLMLPVLAFENYLSTCPELKRCQSWVSVAFVRQANPKVRNEMLKIFYEVFPDPRDKESLNEELSQYGLALKK